MAFATQSKRIVFERLFVRPGRSGQPRRRKYTTEGQIMFRALVAAAVTGLMTLPGLGAEQDPEQTVLAADDVLEGIMSEDDLAIHAAVLRDAVGILIVPMPRTVRLVVGTIDNRCVLVTRDEANRWQRPKLMRIRGASVGPQASYSESRYLKVFLKSERLKKVVDKGQTSLLLGAGLPLPISERYQRKVVRWQNARPAHDERLYPLGKGYSVGACLALQLVRSGKNAEAGYYGTSDQLPRSAATLLEHLENYCRLAEAELRMEESDVKPDRITRLPPIDASRD